MTGINIPHIYTKGKKKTSWVLKPRSELKAIARQLNLEEMELPVLHGVHRPMQLLRAPSLLHLSHWLRGSAAALPAGGESGRRQRDAWLAGRDGGLPPLQAWCLTLHTACESMFIPSSGGTPSDPWDMPYPGSSAQQDEYTWGNSGKALSPLWFLITLVKSRGMAFIKFDISE